MTPRRRALGLLLGLVLVTLQVGTVTAAQPKSDGDLSRNGTYRSSLALDAATCRLFGVKPGCSVPIETIVSDQAPAAGQVALAAAITCKKAYSHLNFSTFGNLYGQDAYIHIPICFNGSTIWHGGPEGAWGPDCWIANLALGYGWDSTWCGIVANKTDHMQAGHNWSIFPYILPFSKTKFWARMNFRTNGTFWWTGGKV